jgi:hypothetical protein
MKLSYFTKPLSIVGRWMLTAMLCASAIAFVWQGAFFSDSSALASSSATLIAADLGDQIKDKADDVRAGSKKIIRENQDAVKKTANKNASKVDRTDERGGYFERKAQRDHARIENRADRHAVRTERAVDKSMDAVKDTVDNAKDAFRK